MLDGLKAEFSVIDDKNKLSWLYEQDDKYGIMLRYATEDESDEIMEVIDWVFAEILKLK